ncbi:MAG TPA: RICIN domain-containing protein [Opitutus sp.]|nr:RICIN domain-containing protein [Opitutus sp.]
MNRITPHAGFARRVLIAAAPWLLAAAPLSAGVFPNGVNLQPSYYNNGNVNMGWSLMNSQSAIGTTRIEIEPDKVTQARTWISQARANGKTVIASYHKASVLGSDSTSELTAAANWWRSNYSTLNSSGSFTVNLMNEWGSHSISSNAYASAYNSAISTVRQVYGGAIVVDIPGWGQETRTAAEAVRGTNGTRINDTNIILSTHIYPGAWNQRTNNWLQNSDLDEMGNAGRPCIVGEFGNGSGSANWSGLVDHARSKGWTVLAWAWNGDGGSLNMVTPSWASNATATSFSLSSYHNVVYPKLGGSTGGGGGGGGTGPVAAGTYSLRNRATGKMLDNLGSTANGAGVGQWADGSSNNQRWVLSYTGGYAKLMCVNGSKYLDSMGRTGNDTQVGQWENSTSFNQQWTITSVGGGYYRIVNRANGLALDTGGATNDGAIMEHWASGSSYNQQWQFVAP